MIEKNSEEALNQESFHQLRKDTLIQIISSDNLNCKESIIFDRTISWVQKNVEGQENQIKTIGEILKYIRFTLMSENEILETSVNRFAKKSILYFEYMLYANQKLLCIKNKIEDFNYDFDQEINTNLRKFNFENKLPKTEKLKDEMVQHRHSLFGDIFRKMLQEKKYSDVVFSIDKTEFHLHRCFLATFSEFFDNLIIKSREQKKNGPILISHDNATNFQILVNYFYSGKSFVNYGEIIQLFKTSELYLVR